MTDWIDKAKKSSDNQKNILSFEEYMKHFDMDPTRQARTTSSYLADMMDYFGRTEDNHFKLFTMDHPDAPPVFGQYKTQDALYLNLKNFQAEGFNSKFILLVGPNGSSKSSIIRKMMKGAEEYSKVQEGETFTFSWIFPVDSYIKGSLGLKATETKDKKLKTYAYLEDHEVSAIINSELKDHPLLLIPREYRQDILEKSLKGKSAKHFEKVKKTYLYQGDLSKRNRMIYDALLKSYKGDHEEVLKHIRIERFHISRRYSNAAVTIEPQMHVDAKLQQITMDKRLASLPPSLQSLNLFSMQGELVLANRGILEYSDLLKRPLDAFKYLLMSVETSHVNLQGIITMLDVFFVGTSNEIHLEAFKQHPDFKSFEGRFNFVKVPYLLNYIDEQKIYIEQIEGLEYKSKFEPHALNLLCLYAVMTRLRAPQGIDYRGNEKLKEIVTEINPLHKALLYGAKVIPKHLDSESKQVLEHGIEELRSEFERDPNYEGRFGISPRDMKKIIYKLTQDYAHITVIDVLEYLKKFIARKNDFDFLNIPIQGDYHSNGRFMKLLEDYAFDIFDKELRDCLGLVDNRSYEDFIKRYIQNINAKIKGEKIKNEVTGKYEDGSDYFILEFEKSIDLKETPEEFRSHLISKLGAYYLDNPGSEITYCQVLPDLVIRLKDSFKEEQNKLISIISTDLIYYESEVLGKKMQTPLSEENRERIETIVNNLMSRYNYSKNGAITILKQLLKEKY